MRMQICVESYLRPSQTVFVLLFTKHTQFLTVLALLFTKHTQTVFALLFTKHTNEEVKKTVVSYHRADSIKNTEWTFLRTL